MRCLRSSICLLAGALVVIGALAVPAHATPLLPATTINNPQLGPDGVSDFTLGLPGYFVPGNLVGTLVSADLGAFTGTVTSKVYTDPGDGGTLGFEYVFTNTTPGPNLDLVRATIGGPTSPWLGVAITDAGADESGTSTTGGTPVSWSDGDPNFLLRDPTVSGEGLTIQWRVASDGTVIRNTTDFSARIWFDTDSPAYTTGNVGLLDSGSVAFANAFVPIPEPSTFSLAALGLLSLGFIGWRRRSRA